jgi:hypothetical protein
VSTILASCVCLSACTACARMRCLRFVAVLLLTDLTMIPIVLRALLLMLLLLLLLLLLPMSVSQVHLPVSATCVQLPPCPTQSIVFYCHLRAVTSMSNTKHLPDSATCVQLPPCPTQSICLILPLACSYLHVQHKASSFSAARSAESDACLCPRTRCSSPTPTHLAAARRVGRGEESR